MLRHRLFILYNDVRTKGAFNRRPCTGGTWRAREPIVGPMLGVWPLGTISQWVRGTKPLKLKTYEPNGERKLSPYERFLECGYIATLIH